MDIELERDKIGRFIKVGICVMSAVLVLMLFGMGIPNMLSMAATKKLPIYCAAADQNRVSLTFDGAWGNEDTATLLSILSEENVKATFFFTGGWIEKFPEDIKTILAEGHEIGNHSENHKHMSELSKEQCKEELQKAHNRIKELTGIDMTLFRAPFGDYNNTVIESANELGYHVIQWDVDSLDWKDYGVQSIIKTVCNHKHLGNGSIILMHNGAKYTKDALRELIKGVKEKGYEFVRVSELINAKDFNYTLDHEGRQVAEK